jgi:hypothetical protein
MSHQFTRSGVRFQYPDNWKLEVQDSGDGWSATVSSPDTAFLFLSYHADQDDPAALADAALEAMRETYPDLESETTVESLANTPAIGYDLDFFMLDLINSCRIRALSVHVGCLLLMSQCVDDEQAGNGEVLRAIGASLSISNGEPVEDES